MQMLGIVIMLVASMVGLGLGLWLSKSRSQRAAVVSAFLALDVLIVLFCVLVVVQRHYEFAMAFVIGCVIVPAVLYFVVGRMVPDAKEPAEKPDAISGGQQETGAEGRTASASTNGAPAEQASDERRRTPVPEPGGGARESASAVEAVRTAPQASQSGTQQAVSDAPSGTRVTAHASSSPDATPAQHVPQSGSVSRQPGKETPRSPSGPAENVEGTSFGEASPRPVPSNGVAGPADEGLSDVGVGTTPAGVQGFAHDDGAAQPSERQSAAEQAAAQRIAAQRMEAAQRAQAEREAAARRRAEEQRREAEQKAAERAEAQRQAALRQAEQARVAAERKLAAEQGAATVTSAQAGGSGGSASQAQAAVAGFDPERYFMRATLLRDRGLFSAAAKLYAECASLADDRATFRRASIEEIACYVKGGMHDEARSLAESLKAGASDLTMGERIKVDAVLKLADQS